MVISSAIVAYGFARVRWRGRGPLFALLSALPERGPAGQRLATIPGVVPGVFQVLAVDLGVARPAGALYRHLHLRKSSPLTRLQREMLATVVNGKVGGAP